MTAPNATPQQATVAMAVESSAVARSGTAARARAGASSGSGQATARPTAEKTVAATKSAGKPPSRTSCSPSARTCSGRRKNDVKVRKKQKFAAVRRAKQAVRVEGDMGAMGATRLAATRRALYRPRMATERRRELRRRRKRRRERLKQRRREQQKERRRSPRAKT